MVWLGVVVELMVVEEEEEVGGVLGVVELGTGTPEGVVGW